MAKLNATRGSTSRVAVVFLPDSASTTGGGKTGLTNASAGLNISVRREKVAAVTAYTGANVLTITTLGTWADPGAGKVRFKEIDSTNQPGMYELQFLDSLFDASDTSRYISGMVQATGVAPTPLELALDATDAQNAASGGMTNLDATVSSRSTYAGADTAGTTTLLSRLTSGRATNLDNLDAAVSTRSTYAGGDTAGTTTLLARLTAGRATNLDNLDAAISSRSTYAGADTAGTTTLLSRLTSGRATNLDNLDAAVSTRSTYAGGDTSGTTTLLGRLTSGRATNLDNLDAAVSSRLATAGYIAPLDAAGTRSAVGLAAANLDIQLSAIDDFIDTEVNAIKAVTDKLNTAMEADGLVYRFTVNALEMAPAGGGGGGTLDPYAKSYLYGDVYVGDEGSFEFRDADDPLTKRLLFARRVAPGGRAVTKDPV
jgi:hypothetical protein